MNSWVPLPEMPPGVLSSIAWPNSCATTSIEEIQVGLNAVNAYYDGTKVAIGDNQAGDWISSLDVVAHEFGHAIDDNTPGGISGNGTQEFIADTFGASTEFYDNQSSPY